MRGAPKYLLLLVLFSIACSNVPVVDEKIIKACELLNNGVVDYVGKTQILLDREITRTFEVKQEQNDPEAIKKCDELIKLLREYYALGEQLPKTMQELVDWANQKSLP